MRAFMGLQEDEAGSELALNVRPCGIPHLVTDVDPGPH